MKKERIYIFVGILCFSLLIIPGIINFNGGVKTTQAASICYGGYFEINGTVGGSNGDSYCCPHYYDKVYSFAKSTNPAAGYSYCLDTTKASSMIRDEAIDTSYCINKVYSDWYSKRESLPSCDALCQSNGYESSWLSDTETRSSGFLGLGKDYRARCECKTPQDQQKCAVQTVPIGTKGCYENKSGSRFFGNYSLRIGDGFKYLPYEPEPTLAVNHVSTCLDENEYYLNVDYKGGSSGIKINFLDKVSFDTVVGIQNPTKTVKITVEKDYPGATIGRLETSSIKVPFLGWELDVHPGESTYAEYMDDDTYTKDYKNAKPFPEFTTILPKGMLYFRRLNDSNHGSTFLTAKWQTIDIKLPTIINYKHICTWTMDGLTDYASGATIKNFDTGDAKEIFFAVRCLEDTSIKTYKATYYNGSSLYAEKTCDTKSGETSCKVFNPMTVPYKKGHSFQGWGDKDGCASGKIEAESTISQNVKKYACFKDESKKYTAKFNLNGGKLNTGKTELSCTTLSSSCNVSPLPTVTKDGYIFKGWGDSSSCKSGRTDYLSLTANKTYYACWEEREYTYKVTFDSNSGMIDGDVEKICDTTSDRCKITDLPSATRDGYKFKGWGESKTCTSGETNSITISSSNAKYYACWEKTEDTYIVTFDPNTGILSGDPQLSCVTKESSCTLEQLPAAIKDGYVFNGWSTDPKCLYGNVEKLTLIELNSTYYACWLRTLTEPTKYTVTFYNGTNEIKTSSCTVNEGEALCKLQTPTPNPQMPGKEFTGWGDYDGCTQGDKNYIDVHQNASKYACYFDLSNLEPEEKDSSSPVVLYVILGIIALGIIGAGVWFLWKVKKSNTNY